MRKTKEGFQVLTALERAERRLAEAIDYAKRESNHTNSESTEADKAVEDAMMEFKKVAMEDSEQTPEAELIEKVVEEDEKNKILVNNILGKDIFNKTQEKFLLDEDLRNEEFHDGYDSLDKVAIFNNAIKAGMEEPEETILIKESEEYEVKCFNSNNIFDGECYEPEDIMPTNYFLKSFDDEDEKDIKPYRINEALILGEEPSKEDYEDHNPESLADFNENVEEGTKKELEELAKQEIRKEIEKEKEEILEKAKKEAEEIIFNAQKEAKQIIDEQVNKAMEEASEKGFSQGFEKGQNEGFLAAENAVNEGMIQEANAFREELELSIKEFDNKKNEMLNEYLNELTDLSINVAEKVIKISLKSSKDVVAKMIVAAAEDCRQKSWAKVYISQEDKSIAMNLEKGLIDALNQISSNVKVVVMEDEPSGTCIIESPDQIVDASVGTQLDNIRQVVKDNKV